MVGEHRGGTQADMLQADMLQADMLQADMLQRQLGAPQLHPVAAGGETWPGLSI